MRFSSLSCGSTLRILRLYLKVAIFQPELQEHAPRTTFVLKSCDFQAGAAADQGGIEPATAGLRKQARKPRDNFQRPFREQEFARRHSESASTRTISAEGSLRLRQIRTAPQRERVDTHDPRKGSRAACRNLKKSTVFESRPRESPQRVARGRNRKNSSVFEPRPRESPQRVARAC